MGLENLASIIEYIYPDTKPGKDWVVEQDGDNYEITKWVVPNIPKPTIEEIMARESEYLARPKIKTKERLKQDLDALSTAHFRQLSDVLLKEMIINQLTKDPQWAIKNGINLPGTE